MLASSATNKLRCESRIDQSTLWRFTSSIRVPALASQIAPMRPLGLIALPVARGNAESALAAHTAMMMAIVTSARIPPARNQSKIAHFKAAILNLIRKPDLAAVGHGLELPAFFPWFLLVPWD